MKIPVIIGPTASGKTELAIIIAENLPVEIVLADSRKVYRYLDIGTAKPSYYLQRKAKFHLIDVCDPDCYFSAGDYGDKARQIVKKIINRKKIPLIVGGSGLYIESIFHPLPLLPKPDPTIRKEIDNQEKEKGLVWLYKQLRKCDKEWAAGIDPNDRQRIKRGLEIFRMTGQPISVLNKKRPPSKLRPKYIGLRLAKGELKERIEKRLVRMINDGLILETRWLLSTGYHENLNGLRTIGYQEVIEYLKGLSDLEELKSKIIRNTLLFAKRQLTWFKRFKGIYWTSRPFPLKELFSMIR